MSEDRADRLRHLLATNVLDRERPGYGFDHYRDGECDYPEAIAGVGRAAFALGDTNLANVCALRLRALDGPPWGLPWEWKGLPPGTGFVTTTVACQHLMLDLGLETDVSWVAEHATVYGEGCDLVVWNSLAQAAGLLVRAGEHLALADALVEMVEAEIHCGLFPYGRESPHHFEQHQAMCAEGLLLATPEESTPSPSVEINLAATLRLLFEDTAQGRFSVDRSEWMWVQHAAIQAWCMWKAGYSSLAADMERVILDNYVDPGGRVLVQPGGKWSVRMAAMALSALARIDYDT